MAKYNAIENCWSNLQNFRLAFGELSSELWKIIPIGWKISAF
jgi:hypothetical protein